MKAIFFLIAFCHFISCKGQLDEKKLEDKPDHCELCSVEAVSQSLTSAAAGQSKEAMVLLLCTWHKDCGHNIEFSQYYNEALFTLISEHPSVFCQIDHLEPLIMDHLENPISDAFDLIAIQKALVLHECHSKVIKALERAISKY